AKQHRTVKDVNVITNKSNGNGLMLMSAGANSNSTIDTLYYVINFDNEQGFAFASADIRFEPVLCITENGNYYSGDSIDNPGFANFMEGLEIYMDGAPPINCPTCPTFFDTITGVYYYGSWENYQYVPEKLTVRWDQTNPYGNNCPNGIAGCVATAIAQIFSYYQYPTNHTKNGVTFTYNWTTMKQHMSYPNYSYYTNASTYLAYLCYNDIGLGVNMDYSSSSGSGAYDSNARSYLVNRGYTSSSVQNYSINDIITALNQDKLIYASGAESSTSDSGHAWVIDGYLTQRRTVTYELSTYYEYQNLVHCNWGWSGYGNGYFVSGAFATRKISDSGSYSASTNYNYNNKIIITKH
ncbi:MAG: C10 family peptidase, partial [Prevotellaceae bacterium]|nr:C10 family peptidase [Prevotellaceae bacterium]